MVSGCSVFTLPTRLFHLQLLQLSVHVVVALCLGLVEFANDLGMNSQRPWYFFGWWRVNTTLVRK